MVALQESRVSFVTQGRTSRKSPTKSNCNSPAILRAARAVARWVLLGGIGVGGRAIILLEMVLRARSGVAGWGNRAFQSRGERVPYATVFRGKRASVAYAA
jgi:hypothetical protein